MKMLVGMKGIEPPYTCSQSKPTAIVSHSDVTERKAEQVSNPHKIQWWTKNKNTQKTSKKLKEVCRTVVRPFWSGLPPQTEILKCYVRMLVQ